MMTKSAGNRWVWFAGLAAVLIGTGLAVMAGGRLMRGKTYSFYYPYPGTSRFGIEKRVLSSGNKKIRMEETLVREYALGPMNYRFHLKLPDGLQVINVWLVPDGLLVVNLNNRFLDYLRQDNEDCRLFIEGLIRTLNRNTRVLRLSVLSDNRAVKGRAGAYSLEHPLPVGTER